MVVHTLPILVGPGTFNPITPNTTLTARWVKITTVGGPGVVGGVADPVDANNGARIPAGVIIELPENTTDPTDVYQLSELKAFMPNAGTSMQFTYGS